MRINGRCHCGNISFSLLRDSPAPEVPARACGCSFCQKHGGVWTSLPDARLEVSIAERADVMDYAFGSRTAAFLVCRRCGVVPVVTSEIDGQTYAVVNVNCFEGVDPAVLARSATSFDGEETADRLARRQANWIGNVVVSASS